jgi:hypothetical protein
MECLGTVKNYVKSHLPAPTKRNVLLGVAMISVIALSYLLLSPKRGAQLQPIPLKCFVGKQTPCNFKVDPAYVPAGDKANLSLLQGLGAGFRKLGTKLVANGEKAKFSLYRSF